MGAFANKLALRTAIRDYQEWDSSLTDAKVDLSIALAEDTINGDLMQPPASGAQGGVQRMLATTTGNFTSGSRTVPMPTDFLGMKSFYYVDGTGDNKTLAYMTPDGLIQSYGGAATSTPAAYTIIGANAELGPAPDSGYAYTQVYFARVPPLALDADTNWVLDVFPTAYLFGALLQNSFYLMDDERITSVIAPGYAQAMERIRQDSMRAAFPSSNLSITINGATP